jgi:uncharacterized membrane protein
MPAREKHMDQDETLQDRNGHGQGAFGQSQPITDKPAPAQAKNSTNGNGAGRFLQPRAAQPDGQGETAPRSIPVKSMLGTSSGAVDASLGAVGAWPSVPNNRDANAYSPNQPNVYPPNQPGALPTPPALRSPGAMSAADAGRLAWEAADSWGDVSYTIRMTANMAAGLSYALWWVTGIVFWFGEKRNRYVRFHAWQSLMWTAALTVLAVIGFLLTSWVLTSAASLHQPMLDALGQALKWIFILGILGLWLWPMVAAFTGHYLRLPWIFGKSAERYSALPRDPVRRQGA